MTDETGNIVWDVTAKRPFGDFEFEAKTVELSAYTGNSTDGSYTIENPLRFPGQYSGVDYADGIHQFQTKGPYYNWNRWYRPNVSRYFQLDSLDNELNYNYAIGNPINRVDPDGEEPFDYNAPEPRTGRLHNAALELARCIALCLDKRFVVTGGSECDPRGTHTPSSRACISAHCGHRAFDMRPRGMDQREVFCCALGCNAKCILNESPPHHWHFQTSPCQRGSRGVLPTEADCKKPQCRQ